MQLLRVELVKALGKFLLCLIGLFLFGWAGAKTNGFMPNQEVPKPLRQKLEKVISAKANAETPSNKESGKVVFRLEHPTATTPEYKGPYQLAPILPVKIMVKYETGARAQQPDDIWQCETNERTVTDDSHTPIAYNMLLHCGEATYVIIGLRFER